VAQPYFNPLNAELNPVCHLLALLGAHHILHVSRIRVNPLGKTFKCVGEVQKQHAQICNVLNDLKDRSCQKRKTA
jgi:hypothetical protein